MSKTLLYIGLAGAAGYYFMKAANKPSLEFFSPLEFNIWYPAMDNKLLLGLDELRRRWGHPIMISSALGALGRKEGNEKSWHFPRNGIVHAADIMPTKDGKGLTPKELTQFYNLVRSMNWFSGVGVYPDWKPYPGLHLDTRTDRMADNPAKWAGVQTASGQKYVAIEQVLV